MVNTVVDNVILEKEIVISNETHLATHIKLHIKPSQKSC